MVTLSNGFLHTITRLNTHYSLLFGVILFLALLLVISLFFKYDSERRGRIKNTAEQLGYQYREWKLPLEHFSIRYPVRIARIMQRIFFNWEVTGFNNGVQFRISQEPDSIGRWTRVYYRYEVRAHISPLIQIRSRKTGSRIEPGIDHSFELYLTGNPDFDEIFEIRSRDPRAGQLFSENRGIQNCLLRMKRMKLTPEISDSTILHIDHSIPDHPGPLQNLLDEFTYGASRLKSYVVENLFVYSRNEFTEVAFHPYLES